jgi:hypothetical protein
MSDPTLERLIAEAAVLAGGVHECAVLGHDWQPVGGAGRETSDGRWFSVPVHECRACGDCDYGENDEASAKREEMEAGDE